MLAAVSLSGGGSTGARRQRQSAAQMAGQTGCARSISAIAATRSAEPLDTFQKTALIAIFLVTAVNLVLAAVDMVVTAPCE